MDGYCVTDEELADEMRLAGVEVELVPWDSRCPECDEQRMDWLVWVSDESDEVECTTCHNIYTPPAGGYVPAEMAQALAWTQGG